MNLFEDTNVAHFFYKFDQTCGTNNNGDNHYELDGVVNIYRVKCAGGSLGVA
jgi:hypothetical protein